VTNKYYIQSYCTIQEGKVFKNGEALFQGNSEETSSFFKEIYRFLNCKYGKFFKMDLLSKLCFLGAEVLLTQEDNASNTAIILSNNASSLVTDRKHQDAIQDLDAYYPSPAVFVYTLPNIGIGEISIKHGLQSENGFFIFNDYNATFHYNYEQALLQSNQCSQILGGWVNVDANSYKGFMYTVGPKKGIPYTEENLIKLYTN